jgi:hypothetical protein
MPKIQAENSAENCCGYTEFTRLVKFRRTMADVGISSPGKISAPSQNLSGKVWRPLTIWARQNLPLLTSSWSGWRALVQILRCVDSHTCRPQVIWRLWPLCFYGRRLSRTVPAGCTGTTCQNFRRCPKFMRPRKIHTWSLLLSKFSYHTHRLLNGGRPRLWVRLPRSGHNPLGEGVCRGGEGERKWSAGWLPLLSHLDGEGGYRGRGVYALVTDCTLHTCSFLSHSSFSYLVLLQRPLSI